MIGSIVCQHYFHQDIRRRIPREDVIRHPRRALNWKHPGTNLNFEFSLEIVLSV